MASREEIQRVAAAMNAHRPDWRLTSLTTFLTDRCSQRPYRVLAIAAVAIATDPKCATPNLLAQDGPWWAGAFAATGDKPPVIRPADLPRCSIDGHEHELLPCKLCRAERIGGDGDTAPVVVVTAEQAQTNAKWAARIKADLRNGIHLDADPDVAQDEQTGGPIDTDRPAGPIETKEK